MKYSAQQYAGAFRELVKEAPLSKRRGVILDFLSLLAKNNAFSLLPDIMREYETRKARERGTKEVVAWTPERISKAGLARKLLFRAEIDSRRDARLGGGIVLMVEDTRVDNSILKRLTRLRKALTE